MTGFRLAIPALLSLVVLSTGCAPIWAPIDERTPRPFPMTPVEMTMNMPQGWMSSYYAPVGGYFFFTVHGAELEEIWIRRWPKTQIVKGTNRNVSANMTIQDMSKLSIDSRRLDDGVGAFEVLSNRPASVGDQDCYRLDYRYRNAIGLPKRSVEYGCSVGAWLYRFEFIAPTQYYFDRYLDDFEAMAKSIRFTVKGI
jgi:hypothetical protein